MKTLRLFGMALMAVLMCVNFASCNSEEVTPDDPNQDKYITVGLDCVGEYLDIKDSPLSRATGDDFYNIQVFSLEEYTMDGDVFYNEIPYAYGYFETSLNGVTIKLLQGKDYRFKVGIVIGGVGYTGSSNSREFNYSSTNTIYPDGNIPVDCEGFYGELDKYTPEEGGSVEISTKRVSYAAKFIAEGLTEGTLNINVNKKADGGGWNLYSVALTTTNSENDKIYSFYNAKAAWRGIETATGNYDPTTGQPIYEYKNYTCEKNLDISWTKANDEIIPLGTYTVTFKRNIRTTIRIKAEELSVSNGITVTREDTPISDDDNEYLIEGGQVTIVPINSAS